MLEARAGGVSPAVVAALQLSYWTAPSEAWIVGPRLAFATDLVLAGVAEFDAEYHADLRRFASFARNDRVAAAYVDRRPRLRGALLPLIARQPDDRRRAIVAEIDRLGVDVCQGAKPMTAAVAIRDRMTSARAGEMAGDRFALGVGERWYVAMTAPRKERIAEINLANQGFRAFLPRQLATRRHAR